MKKNTKLKHAYLFFPENPSCDILALHCDNDKDDALLDQFDLNKFEDVSKNNIAISDFQDDNDNYLSEETLLEILGSPLYDYLNSAQILNDKSCQIALSNEQNNQLTRPHFSHDVKTYQKNNYLTNVFPLGQESIDKSIVGNTKKGISCVQGIKKQENERLQVLPKIKGLQQFQNEPDTDLYIYGVHEELKDNYCICLNEITFTKDGEFELEIYMLTKWEKNKNELKLHQLDETSTRHLRSAIHQTQTTKTHMPPVRLLGVLKRANSFDWNNFFLSDFIQPPPGNASKRSSSSVDLTVDTYEPKPKKTESTQTYFTIN
ncbi:unnamed protein product [Rotaria sordida]|uniref:Uncharacterized protein n=1 Tax=Rotaria sordida TaxID=392033 RepID=A0A819EHA8_9BILA|nr:unnamed protein product [Rotaria sordida]